MTTLELLKAARARIERPEAWTREGSARNAAGRFVNPLHSEAVCWCSVGALGPVGLASNAALTELRKTIGSPNASVAEWNDRPTRTHAEVLDLFDRTIARLEATS